MPLPTDIASANETKQHLGDFAKRFAREATPYGPVFSYFAVPAVIAPEDLPDFVDEPISALPPRVLDGLREVMVLFVPFLERPPVPAKSTQRNRSHSIKDMAFDHRDITVAVDPPSPANSLSSAYIAPESIKEPHVLTFAAQDIDSSDYHFNFFHAIARLLYTVQPDSVMAGYRNLLQEELKNRAHGEVDDASWKAKIDLLKKESGVRGESKLFMEYSHRSFVDTMTLYLHGICCDIDVEPGPRQIASRYLRKRLQLLQTEYPPPDGYAVFPEELKN